MVIRPVIQPRRRACEPTHTPSRPRISGLTVTGYARTTAGVVGLILALTVTGGAYGHPVDPRPAEPWCAVPLDPDIPPFVTPPQPGTPQRGPQRGAGSLLDQPPDITPITAPPRPDQRTLPAPITEPDPGAEPDPGTVPGDPTTPAPTAPTPPATDPPTQPPPTVGNPTPDESTPAPHAPDPGPATNRGALEALPAGEAGPPAAGPLPIAPPATATPAPDASTSPNAEPAPGTAPAEADAARVRLLDADGTGYGADFTRSLIYSGLLALLLATIGIAMVGWRRRQW
jgi:hypothetical protein